MSNIIRFVLHFVEMAVAMQLGMLIYMPLQGALPGALQQIGMALFMAWPMVLWMRIRGHGWRHGVEMAVGMLLPWAAVVGLNGLGAANVLPWLRNADGLAMYLGMLVVMLARRGHYAHRGTHQAASPRPRLQVRWRPLLLGTASVAAIVLVPFAYTSFNWWNKMFVTSEPLTVPAFSDTLPAPPAPDTSKKIAVVLSGPRGAEINDTMDAFEVLSRSGLYNVYSVAPERTALPLLPGPTLGASSLDFVPHYSFDEYDGIVGRAPDLIAIPWFDGGYSAQADGQVLEWIRRHFGADTTILGICSGNMILADTGLLAGRTATSNSGTFQYVESHSPSTTWLRNVRYVDDGNIISTSNLTSGIAGALHVVDRFGGRALALDVARQIGYTTTQVLDDPTFVAPADSLLLRGALAGLAPTKEQIGVVLYDGASELGLSGLIDPYLGTFSTRTYVMSAQRQIVQSRGGFLLLPRYTFDEVPALDRVLVPAGDDDNTRSAAAAAWSTRSGASRSAEDLYATVGHGESAYDVSFRDLAQHRGGLVARTVADTLFYPLQASALHDATWPLS